MTHGWMFVLLLALLVISAVFSGSETAMMSLNRYRLRHLAKRGDRQAARAQKLLARPDRLLGVILIGNTLANILAASVTTILAVNLFGQSAVWLATLVLTLVVLIFAEIMPKTVAANYPEKIGFNLSWFLAMGLKILYPFIWLINAIANTILRIFRIKIGETVLAPVSLEELSTMVESSGQRLNAGYRKMLQRVFAMEQATVEDVMIARQEIVGIDLSESWEKNLKDLHAVERDHVPVYEENIDKLHGILQLRKFWVAMANSEMNKQKLVAMIMPPYFVPEGTALSKQFAEFKRVNRRVGFVVDEYGDIQGMVSVRGIVTEIIGELDINANVQITVAAQPDGSNIIKGNAMLRDVNRHTGWDLPTKGPKTISGMVVEHLQVIPDATVCFKMGGYSIEVLAVEDNTIATVRIWPPKEPQENQ